ncbi:MAG TPA: hypothetical protein VHI93_01890, partial [Candidatus Thermoplasmatota archaeon]|nr:hypothetical protein [Candidatus Thermoplasmatota archaeon]
MPNAPSFLPFAPGLDEGRKEAGAEGGQGGAARATPEAQGDPPTPMAGPALPALAGLLRDSLSGSASPPRDLASLLALA